MRSLLLALAAGAAVWGCSPPPSPTWAEPGKRVRYACGEAPDTALDITFSDDGREARINEQGRTLVLRFLEERGELEVYAGEGFTLSLDPDALLLRPDNTMAGPCRRSAAP